MTNREIIKALECGLEFFIPSRDDVENLRVGSEVIDCFGRRNPITEIFYRGISVHGKAYVGFYTRFGENSTISGSLVEGQLVRTVQLSNHYTSAQLDAIEAFLNSHEWMSGIWVPLSELEDIIVDLPPELQSHNTDIVVVPKSELGKTHIVKVKSGKRWKYLSAVSALTYALSPNSKDATRFTSEREASRCARSLLGGNVAIRVLNF